MAESGRARGERMMTPANVVTLVRILLVPVFVIALISPWPEWFGFNDITIEFKSFIAAGIFVVISCTDWIDGYLARSRNEVTDFGKFMDPLADKILVCAALLALIELGVLPSWPVLIILVREFIVAGVRMVAASHGVVIAASWYGKAKTVTQIVAIVLFLVKDFFFHPLGGNDLTNPLYVLSWAVMIAALVLTVLSMVDYLSKARDLIGFSLRKPSAVNEQAEEVTPEDSGVSDLADVGKSLLSLEERIALQARCAIEKATCAHVTLGTAESLTGGLIASSLTSVPGSSAVVRGGIVSYVNDVKHGVLDVPEDVLSQQGAVSEECAIAMARGARQQLGADFAVSVTGIAGPGGAEPGKPVGTVWMGFASSEGATANELHFEGDRHEVRLQTVLFALERFGEALESITEG